MSWHVIWCIRKRTKKKRKIPVLLLVLLCVLVCVCLTFLRCFSILSRHQYAKQQGNAHNMQLILQVTLNKQLQIIIFCPSCVCVSLLPLPHWSQNQFPSQCEKQDTDYKWMFIQQQHTINMSLDDAPCYQHVQRKKLNKSNCSKIPLCAVKKDPTIYSMFNIKNVMCAWMCWLLVTRE